MVLLFGESVLVPPSPHLGSRTSCVMVSSLSLQETMEEAYLLSAWIPSGLALPIHPSSLWDHLPQGFLWLQSIAWEQPGHSRLQRAAQSQ